MTTAKTCIITTYSNINVGMADQKVCSLPKELQGNTFMNCINILGTYYDIGVKSGHQLL